MLGAGSSVFAHIGRIACSSRNLVNSWLSQLFSNESLFRMRKSRGQSWGSSSHNAYLFAPILAHLHETGAVEYGNIETGAAELVKGSSAACSWCWQNNLG